MKTNKLLAFVLGFIFFSTSCSDDFLEVKTTNRLTSEAAVATMEADPAKLEGFVNAIYSMMVQYDLVFTNHDAFGYMSILHSTEMMSEDIVQVKATHFTFDYLLDNRGDTYRRTRVNWTYLYSIVSSANIVLNLTSPESTSPEIKAYRGQVLALRGMAYYYLIQLYQQNYGIVSAGTDLPGIPLYYATNEGKPDRKNRVPVKEVYAQIESDLTTAVANLNGWSRGNKNQVNYYVANGILARFYLLSEQWSKAASAALEAQKGGTIMTAAKIHDGFMDIANSEWLWGFDHSAETETRYASFFSHISNITPGYAGLEYGARLIDKRLYEAIPATDERKKLFQGATQIYDATSLGSSSMASTTATGWKLPYASLKFGWNGNWTMDYPYMRTAEMVLIEAEALVRQNKGSEAATALKKLLANRDPAWNQSTVTVDEIWMQRRIELWGEGFAYFDLKRLNKGIDRTYSGTNHRTDAQKKFSAGTKDWIYRIPQTEILENSEIDEADNNE